MAGVQGTIRPFVTTLRGSGRLAPTLLEDLTLYDPRQFKQSGQNLLEDSPLSFVSIDPLGQSLPPQSCHHVFSFKPKQSHIPTLDERIESDTIYIVAAVCQKCLIHVTLKVDYTHHFQDSPCPTLERPFHHLIWSRSRTVSMRQAWLRENPSSADEIYIYECSSSTCSAIITIHLSPPVLSRLAIHTLTDRELLRERTEIAFKSKEGNVEGMKHPTPADVLVDLRAYIRNCWSDDPRFKSIKLSNRRFIVRFGVEGEPCKEVLEELGFKFQPDDCWLVPEPNTEDTRPIQDPDNLYLDNVEHELSALIISMPLEDRQHIQEAGQLVAADREFARVLGCQDYDKDVSSRTIKFGSAERTIPYIGLGAPRDVADLSIIFAYQAQNQSDPTNAPFYLTYLQYIAAERNSESLQVQVALESSSGKFDSETLAQAYKYFGLHMYNGAIDDEHIIGVFTSRLEDSKLHEHEMRNYLRMIGIHRNSKTIIETAENVMNTYEQALQYLGGDASVSDESIQALYTVKVADNTTSADQAAEAVRIIATHRGSTILKRYVDSGFSAEIPLNAAEAYQTLQIHNRSVDDDLILTAYQYIVQENPMNVDLYNKALTAIAEERDSPALRNLVQNTTTQGVQGSTDEPVGLENIGNTCYLNSLLQFLFTITPFRSVVLDFENFKMDPIVENMARKKVGQRQVTLKEVQTSQKFVASLAVLFQGMIQTPQSSIKPQQELARLTLETDSAKEKLRRRSTLMSDRPSLSGIHIASLTDNNPAMITQSNNTNEMAVMSPMEMDADAGQLMSKVPTLKEIPEEQPSNHSMLDSNNAEVQEDNASDLTLVSQPGSPDLEEIQLDPEPSMVENKENEPPATESVSARAEDVNPNQQILDTASKGESNHDLAKDGADTTSVIEHSPIKYQPPPGKPPPVPPRKPVENGTTTLEEYARQQDVTEVLAHCLFQLSCAMRPTGFDSSGEQLDEVHDLFFGKNVSHAVPEAERQDSVQFFSIISRVVHEPVDIYSALDTEFDLSVRDNGSKAFLSVDQLPPVFSIALDRVIWNKEANRPEKLNHHVQLYETIFMDRYLESPAESEQMERRKTTWDLKAELATLAARRSILEEKQAQSKDLPSLWDDAKHILEHLQVDVPGDDDFGGDLDVAPESITTLAALAAESKAELEAIVSRMEVLNQQIKEAFVSFRKYPYRLHAAFFHRGSAGGGHYWVYIYDHKKEIWRKYNDDRVNVVENLNEIFGIPAQDRYMLPANPYFLVYVKEEAIDNLVQTVKRDIIRPESDEFNGSVRNQMTEMPPGGNIQDVEMQEIKNPGEHTQETIPPVVQKRGNWDSSELMVENRIW